jgi:hypothetical protein
LHKISSKLPAFFLLCVLLFILTAFPQVFLILCFCTCLWWGDIKIWLSLVSTWWGFTTLNYTVRLTSVDHFLGNPRCQYLCLFVWEQIKFPRKESFSSYLKGKQKKPEGLAFSVWDPQSVW